MMTTAESPQETAVQMLEGGDSSWLDTFSVLDPKSFLDGFLKENVRPDGRLLHRVRPTVCNKAVLIRNAAGSALVKLGTTQVLGAVTLEVGQPAAGHAKEGDLILDFNFPQKNWIERILNNSVDFTSLCLAEGKAAWRLRVVIMVLNDDSNVEDAALLAAVAALADTKLPQVQFKSDGKVEILSEGEGHSLKLKSVPVPLTVGLYTLDNKTTLLLVDPSKLETDLCKGSITMVVNSQQDIININHAGSLRLTTQDLSLCAQMAFGRAREMTELLVDNSSSS